MFLRQIYQRDLAQASYFIGCQASGEALVIDPNRDIQQYLDLAAKEGMRITAVTETHIHADFVSGARELAARTGATLYLSDEGPAAWKYSYAQEAQAHLLHDGDRFQVGNVIIEAWHTPGHTPEHLSFLVTDGAHAEEPMGIATGDFVFVGDVGRPDLLERAAGISGTMRDGAAHLFDSLQRFKTLPDYVQVWPGHGAGSACGKALGAVPQSTVGYEKRYNWGLLTTDREAFIETVLAGQPEPPAYFARMKQVNRAGPALSASQRIQQLRESDLTRLLEADTLVVDLRDPAAFAARHIPGTVNLALAGSFLTWVGWLVPAEQPVALIGSAAQAERARKLMHLIGLDRVQGYWTPSVLDAWQSQGRALGSITRITPDEARERLAAEDFAVVDVRFTSEYAMGHLENSLHMPLPQLAQQAERLSRQQPVLVYCQGGMRSPIAASILARAGFTQIYDLIGGYHAWSAASRPQIATATA